MFYNRTVGFTENDVLKKSVSHFRVVFVFVVLEASFYLFLKFRKINGFVDAETLLTNALCSSGHLRAKYSINTAVELIIQCIFNRLSAPSAHFEDSLWVRN